MDKEFLLQQRETISELLGRVDIQLEKLDGVPEQFIQTETLGKIRRYGKHRFRELYLFNRYGNIGSHMPAYRYLVAQNTELTILSSTLRGKIGEIDQTMLDLEDGEKLF